MSTDCLHSKKRHQHVVKERGWKTETWRIVRCIACDAFIREVHLTTIHPGGTVEYPRFDVPAGEARA